MPRLSRYMPDAKMIVAVIAASYVAAVAFQFFPQLSPSGVAAQLSSGKK